LLNAYERSIWAGNPTVFADGAFNIPERANKIPDLLDEVRFELNFLQGMQVPPNAPHAGMAHHKIHDVEWTALGLRPDQAEKAVERALRPVSTAATLNLAAVSAQAARLYRKFDSAFADRCLSVSENAYAAATREPNLFATAADSNGGGPYDDNDVSDEFFWAAVELWLTTGKQEYLASAQKSPHHSRMSGASEAAHTSMSWRQTEALGKLSWVYASSGARDPKLRQAQADQIVALADRYVKVANEQGYRLPHAPDGDGKYYWGSNSDVLNNGLILAAGFDLSHKAEYQAAAVWAMDYLLGRNALDQSYVTGYGFRPLENPHHRFWAHQADASFPGPPPGALSGGPNSELQDPYGQAAGLPGCKPQKCFVDNIEAYSLNEIAINWNAPLVWLTTFLDQTVGTPKR
jgi:endoglucanase